MSPGNLRLLRPGDLDGAVELSRLAGWNQTIDDWQMLLRLDPQGCFGIELDDRIVATTTLLCYGDQLAWIGMVLTKPDYRRRGFAQRLMQTALARAASLRTKSIGLDATPEGQPLYEKLGFETEQVVERWFRDGRQATAAVEPVLSLSRPSLEMDREAFGADRTVLLQELACRNPPNGTDEAYGFSREGARCRYLGPCVALEQRAARLVIEQILLESPETGWYWDLLTANIKAVELAEELGFVAQRRLGRMVIGNRLAKNDQLVYAIAGFELG
jgi:ribosomal protein S18 acetylase RimI-like enzyme